MHIDPAAIRAVPIAASLRGATVRAMAHGVRDGDPLPTDTRAYTLEALRPLVPCHLAARVEGGALHVSWVARAASAFGWPDGAEPQAGRFRVVLSDGQAAMPFETAESELVVTLADLPPSPATLAIEVRALGEQAESRAAGMTINI